MVRLGISGLLERLNASLRLLGFSPIARALVPSGLTLEPRPLRSTIITRFTAVGSEEAHLSVLTSVRLSNCTCSFPACSFHVSALARAANRRDKLNQVHQPVLAVEFG
jgi:hypothetical protein